VVSGPPQREQVDGMLMEFPRLIPGRKTGSNVVAGGRLAICLFSSRAANEGYKELCWCYSRVRQESPKAAMR
jgi:hypothetical protein